MKKILFLTAILTSSLLFVNCDNDQITEEEPTITSNVAKQRKASEPIEVTNFRNKIREIAKSEKILTDSEKATILLPAAKELLEVHGMPQDVSKDPLMKTEDEQNTILGFRRFIELIQNK